jgi:hypothetical protein
MKPLFVCWPAKLLPPFPKPAQDHPPVVELYLVADPIKTVYIAQLIRVFGRSTNFHRLRYALSSEYPLTFTTNYYMMFIVYNA